MKAFVALEPSIAVCERLVLLQEDLDDPIHLLGGEIAWRRGDQLRVLLRGFDVEPNHIGWLEGALAESLAALAPPTFSLRGTRFLPSEDRAQFLVTEAASQDGSLERVVSVVNDVLDARGIPRSAGEWRPLLQVGRLRTTDLSPRLHGVARPFSETEYGATTADSAVLWTSTLAAGSLRTRQVRRLPFESRATSRVSAR